MTGRRFLAGVITLLASLSILLTLLAHYANNLSGNSASFAGRAVSVVRTPGVQSLVDSAVTDRLETDTGVDSEAQPLIRAAVQQVLGSEVVSTDVHSAAEALQRQVLSGTASRLTLTLPNLGPSLAASVESHSPLLAEQVKNLGTITVVDVAIPASDERVVHDLAKLGSDSTLLLVLSIALIVLALLVSPDRVRTVRALGIGVALAGASAAAGYLVGREIVVDEFSSLEARTAARAVWSIYLRALEAWGFVLAGVGVVVAILAATQVRHRRPYGEWRRPSHDGYY